MELTREQIKEGNDKIAKLMGLTLTKDTVGGLGHNHKWWYYKECELIWDNMICEETNLQYHLSWDWLMPVIDKIGTIVYHRDDDAPEWNWKDHYSYTSLFHTMFYCWIRNRFDNKKNEFNLMNDLTSVWSSCVAWVDDYEQNKEEKI